MKGVWRLLETTFRPSVHWYARMLRKSVMWRVLKRNHKLFRQSFLVYFMQVSSLVTAHFWRLFLRFFKPRLDVTCLVLWDLRDLIFDAGLSNHLQTQIPSNDNLFCCRPITMRNTMVRRVNTWKNRLESLPKHLEIVWPSGAPHFNMPCISWSSSNFEYDITTWSIQKMGSLLCCTLEANTEISTITSSMLSFVNEEVAWVSFYLFHPLIAPNKPPVYERSEQEHLLFVIVTSTLIATRSKSKSYHHFIYIFFILLNINKSCFRRILAYFIPLRILKGTLRRFPVLDEIFSSFIAAILTDDVQGYDEALERWEPRLL